MCCDIVISYDIDEKPQQFLKTYCIISFYFQKKVEFDFECSPRVPCCADPVLCYLQKQFTKVLPFFSDIILGYISYALIVVIQFQCNGNQQQQKTKKKEKEKKLGGI